MYGVRYNFVTLTNVDPCIFLAALSFIFTYPITFNHQTLTWPSFSRDVRPWLKCKATTKHTNHVCEGPPINSSLDRPLA